MVEASVAKPNDASVGWKEESQQVVLRLPHAHDSMHTHKVNK